MLIREEIYNGKHYALVDPNIAYHRLVGLEIGQKFYQFKENKFGSIQRIGLVFIFSLIVVFGVYFYGQISNPLLNNALLILGSIAIVVSLIVLIIKLIRFFKNETLLDDYTKYCVKYNKSDVPEETMVEWKNLVQKFGYSKSISFLNKYVNSMKQAEFSDFVEQGLKLNKIRSDINYLNNRIENLPESNQKKKEKCEKELKNLTERQKLLEEIRENNTEELMRLIEGS